MELVDGRSPPDEQLAGYAQDGWFVDADPARRSAIWDRFIDHLGALHSLPPETFGPAVRGGTHTAMLDYWTDSLRDVLIPDEAPVQEQALAWLRARP